MSASNFDTIFTAILGYEGHYTNDPRDPGGPTKFGVTQKTLAAWRKKPVSADDVKNMVVTEARAIFKAQYWDQCGGDQLPSGVDFAVVDMAYNSGPGRAVQTLQRVLGVKVDGVAGVFTLNEVRKVETRALIGKFCDARMAFLKQTRGWPTYGRGWTNRVVSVRAKSLGMVGLGGNALAEMGPMDGDTADHKTAFLATSSGQSKVGLGVGLLGSQMSEMAYNLTPYAETFTIVKYAFLGLTALAFAATVYVTITRMKEEDGGA